MAAPSPGLYPRRLGRYTLVAPLGEGGMAAVHVARRDGDPRICVLKQLHAELTEHADTNRRFRREAHIASFLQHPGIAHVVDAGMEDGVFCIALEFIAGQTVEHMVRAARARGGTLPFEVAIHVALQALDALAHAHALQGDDGHPVGLVHRDLSPRNLMVGYDGQVKIIDFGIAKGRVDDHRTALGTLMGTPYYMSPEQTRGAEVDHRSDLYTLSAVLFEMLTGRRLVTTKGRANILMSVVHDPAPDLRERNPHAPEALAPVLAQGLRKAPEERFPSAAAYREALESAYRASQRGPGALTRIGARELGEFLRQLSPDGEQKARALLAQVRAGAAPELEHALTEATRLAPTPPAPRPRATISAPTRTEARVEIEAAGFETPPLEPTMFGLPDDTARGGMLSASTPAFAELGRGHGPSPLTLAAGAALVAAAAFAAGLAWRSEPRPTPLRSSPPAAVSLVPPAEPQRAIIAPPAAAAPAAAAPTAAARSSSKGSETSPSRPTSDGALRSEARRRRRAPSPAERKPSPRPASAQPRAELGSALKALRQRPTVEGAVDLAERMRQLAGTHLGASARARVEAEADRVLRTGDIDAMLEALATALREFER